MGPEQGERGYRVETKMFLLGKGQCCDYLDRTLGKESCDNEDERQDHRSTGIVPLAADNLSFSHAHFFSPFGVTHVWTGAQVCVQTHRGQCCVSLSFFSFNTLNILFMYICMCLLVCVPHISSSHRDQKRVLDNLETVTGVS